MAKDVMLVTGAGQISMALARRVGFGKKIVLGDKNPKNCETVAKIMNDAGYDVEPFIMDLSSRESILAMIKKGQEAYELGWRDAVLQMKVKIFKAVQDSDWRTRDELIRIFNIIKEEME